MLLRRQTNWVVAAVTFSTTSTILSASLTLAWTTRAAVRAPHRVFSSRSSTRLYSTAGYPMHPVKPVRGPRLKIPDPICSTEPGTWSYDTMTRRVNEEILERTWNDNKELWESDKEKYQNTVDSILELRHELKNAADTRLAHIDDLPEAIQSSDYEDAQIVKKEWQMWHDALDPYVKKEDTWLTAPWMIAEFFVYRRLMQCIGYFDRDSPGHLYDPFAKAKTTGIHSSVGSAEPMLGKVSKLTETDEDVNKEGLDVASSLSLWGNQMDLSLWPADSDNAGKDIFSSVLEKAHENLLHDDSQELVKYANEILKDKKGGGNVDIIVDNAGFELVTDLALAQYLIDSKIAKTVTFQLKAHPTFVSDAMEKDLRQTVEYYANLSPKDDDDDDEDYPNCRAAGKKWQGYLDNGQWVCNENFFWVQGLPMWNMPDDLYKDMHERCDLAFVKGDCNYRRLLGDRPWDVSNDSFADVVGAYFPCPVCALRTLKAELACGLDSNKVEKAKKQDDEWMTNGKFGVVQFDKANWRGLDESG